VPELRSRRRRHRPGGPGPLLPRRPRRPRSVETTRPPRFLGRSQCVRAPLFDPAGPLASGLYDASDAAYRSENHVGSGSSFLSRLNHAAHTPPVYASQPGSLPNHATLGSGWWPTFAGQASNLPDLQQEVSDFELHALHVILLLQASPGAISAGTSWAADMAVKLEGRESAREVSVR